MHLQHFVPTDRKKLEDGQEKQIAPWAIKMREKRLIHGKSEGIA